MDYLKFHQSTFAVVLGQIVLFVELFVGEFYFLIAVLVYSKHAFLSLPSYITK